LITKTRKHAADGPGDHPHQASSSRLPAASCPRQASRRRRTRTARPAWTDSCSAASWATTRSTR
jgi:hypothetical protein